MPNRWFIGDLHFGHQRVSDIRGFTHVGAHDDHLIKQWRNTIAWSDEVFVMGDLSSGGAAGEAHALDIISRLPGVKHLIAGNHDSVSSIHRNGYKKQRQFMEVFESIQQASRIKLEGEQILLSHYPYLAQGDGPGRGPARYSQWRLPDEGLRLVHAHTHHDHPTSGSSTGRELCVSWDAWRRIVNLGDIAKWIKEGTP